MFPVVLVVSLPLAFAQEPTHDIVLDDQFSLDEVHGLTVNRNGTRVVFVRARWPDGAEDRARDLWVLETRSRKSSRLTFEPEGAYSPSFGTRDETVWFLADDGDDETQVWRIDLDGGAPQRVTDVDGGVVRYSVGRDGHSVWYQTDRDAPVEDEWSALRDAWSDASYADRSHKRSTIHRLDLNTWKTEAVWAPDDGWMIDWAVTPDSGRIAAVTAPDSALITHEGDSRVEVFDTESGVVTRLPDTLWRAEGASPHGWLFDPVWSSDSRALAFRIDHDGYPGESFVAEFAGDEPLLWKVPRPTGLIPRGASLAWVPGTRDLCTRVDQKARVRIVCVTGLRGGKSGRPRAMPKGGDVVVDGYAFSGDGRDVFAVVGTPQRFPEIYRLPARGNLLPQQISDLNPHTQDWKLPELQLVSWTAPDGTAVEGILETPYGWTADDGPLPLVLHIHGGPTAAETYKRRFRHDGRTSFAASGWALLSPNYRGSTGYGDTFVTDLIGQENEIEVADLLAGVDAMVERGIADPAKLAVMGWSNGGYLTHALVSQTPRFKAGSAGAGVIDMVMQWALEDTPGHVINFMSGEQPWAAPEAYQHASPLYTLDRVETPLLIHAGENDPRVPAAHARTLFRGLDTYLGVPSELVIYPGMGHGPRTRAQRSTRAAWDQAWFDKWVLQAPVEVPEPEPATDEPTGEPTDEPAEDDTAEDDTPAE